MPASAMPLRWTVGHTTDPSIPPAEFFSATVPGAVQLDYARAHNWPPYWVADNFKNYAWMEDVYWIYRTELAPSPSRDLLFTAEGIDYEYDLRLDGQIIQRGEGMFHRVHVNLGASTTPRRFEIIIHPAPKSHAAPVGRSQANHSAKPAVSYGWDFHPRLVPLGLWGDTYLSLARANTIASAEHTYHLADDLSFADITVVITPRTLRDDVPGSRRAVRWTLRDPAGAIVHESSFEGSRATVRIPHPALWWPHDQGPQSLYTSTLELSNDDRSTLDARTCRFGIRRARLVMAPGQWKEPRAFPKSRSLPPITLEINGRQIFCKGSNWVSADIFPGTLTRERYAELLGHAKEANMNLLRMWGGSPVNKESFFELCDEMGIMVWQEFPLACNNYPDGPQYLQVLEQEATAIVARLRQHPSVVLYCGGNELFNNWSGMTDQSLALRLLNKICYELDPRTPFIPTSPIEGMGHGHYVFRDEQGREVYQVMAAAANTAYTEFGTPGPAPIETLKSFLPPDQLWPPREGTPWETHHAFGAWILGTHLCLPIIEHYFGKSETLEELVPRGQWLQSEAFKCIFEEARRQKPRCSMALNWCFNEPWPAAANNSLLAWPAVPKPALEAVGDSCRPSLASARIRKFSWQPDDVFEIDLFVLHDAPVPLPAGRVEASVEFGGERLPILAWDYPIAPANTNVPGPTARLVLPKAAMHTDELVLRLDVPGKPAMSSRYRLHFRMPAPATSGPAVLNV